MEIYKTKFMGKNRTIFEAARRIVRRENFTITITTNNEGSPNKDAEIESEQNAFHLVKALDLIDECYHYLKSNPPDKTKMAYSKWKSLVEETDYMREFNADADHDRHNKN